MAKETTAPAEADGARALTAAQLVEKRRKLAKDVITQATALHTAQTVLNAQLQQAQDAGLVFVDTDFADVVGLQHLDAATFNAMGSVVTAVNATLAANNRALWQALAKMIA
jgi:hypothetical protein